ncbi:Dopey, N-terminal-domain-containing protein [Crepidotus variabilis]|uniref:Dopey, N-terminal-domain-containing protein n=1 Tax=Crepidotus variabilis TaxID=179855 RepID=A0A9P6E7U7_9AGAR|nr:Dopey, N-terminal-domain-containing protein [Crepidotus variabilis]
MSSNAPAVSGAEGSGKVVRKGSAWVSAKASERAVALQSYAADPKYKKYVQQVEKCLNSFDNVHEWADCISFLKQMLKTFQSFMQFKEIPRKLIVAKRLAQCLNPALPTGVHQRALEVYVHILSVLGIEGLKRDLALWSSGLFPFFEYAATSVKPALLNIYDTHYLPLQTALRPVMKSFILALLPGLEEETSEFFEKVVGLLDKLSGAVSISFFFQNIWLVMLTSPSARGTSLNFLSRRLPQLNADEDITDVVGKDVGLMIRAFAAALEDENLLVRRGALDILLQSMKANSYTVKKAQKDDRAILMRAATGVVLRRDLSLNRRLYTWLLGTEEKSEAQMAYLREHALDLLTATLKNEMFAPSGDYAESRPFKIFISLLDKWEIGAPLTEALVYDTFLAIRRLAQASTEGGEDLTVTASTLYEGLEPQVLWKHLCSSIFAEIDDLNGKTEAIDLAHFIMHTFSHDEEIQTIHLPLVFSGLLDKLEAEVTATTSKSESTTIPHVFILLESLLDHIPHSALLRRPELNGIQGVMTLRPFDFACVFFKMSKQDISCEAKSLTSPFASCFNSLISLVSTYASLLVSSTENSERLRVSMCSALSLIDRLVGRLSGPIDVAWEPSHWLPSVLSVLPSSNATFTVVDRITSSITNLHRNHFLQPKLTAHDRETMHKMISKLLTYLQSAYTAYHVRAVNLIWILESLTTQSHVEAILAQSMSSKSLDTPGAYEAFGVLWRLTEDTLLPGFHFRIPMLMVLDGLKSEDPALRRVSETWMRCSLKSYIRVLDPILYDFLDPNILRSQTTFKVRGREITGFVYERPFDQRIIDHLLETLLSVVNFGGQGFAKAARTAPIKRSYHTGLVQRVANSGLVDSEGSYLEVLVECLLRFVQSEPKSSLTPSLHHFNTSVQSNAIELLQAIVARGDLDNIITENIEAATVGKLYFSIHAGRLDLQNKWLHLLHSVISVSTANLDSARRTAVPERENGPDTATSQDKSGDTSNRYPLNPLLIQTLVDGISTRSNRPVLQHWLDFILMAVPQFQPTLQAVVWPLNDCLCRQLLISLAEVLRATSQIQDSSDEKAATVTDAELIMLLNGLERLVLLNLAYTSDTESSEDDPNVLDRPTSETTGLLGYVSTVFSSDPASAPSSEQLTSRSPGYRALDDGIRVLYSIWASLIWKTPSKWSTKDDTMSLIYNRTRLRCRRVLEHLFRVQNMEVFESLIDWWSKDQSLAVSSPDAVFELVDLLMSNAQNVVHMLCESISNRIISSTDKSKKQTLNQNLTDATLFKFLEQYMRRLEGPLALQVWPRFIQLVKDIITGSREFKPHCFSALRCLSILAEKVTQTTAMDDKKLRRELQDNYGKLLDTCVSHIGRSTDQGSWIRRSAKETALSNGSGRESPAIRSDSASEKLDSSVASLPETPRLTAFDQIGQIILFVATSALPSLRKVLVENDKVLTVCNNIIYYIINPALRGKTRPMDVDTTAILTLQEMTRIPTALKSWRSTVVDLLNDNRLFNCTPEDAVKWRPIVKALYDADKASFAELIIKASTAPSTNIFTNREYEMLLRSLNLRRLSYVILAGEKNQFLTQLPTIQEKLVDIFRSITSPVVQSEVFLCIRVLLCRLAPNSLTSFWPVVLTEMYRILEQTMTNIPADGSDDLQLILAACKCLDTLLVLQTEEFQTHQWIFITDTVDAIYRPDGWHPEAILDQLGEVVPVGDNPTEQANANHVDALHVNSRVLRKPLLASLRKVESMRELAPFLSSVSISTYESVYASGGNVDWEAVERSIVDDMFDGR